MSQPDKRGTGLKKWTESRKAETCRKVDGAIQSLLDEGYSPQKIKRKDILSRSGVASGTLSKPYIKEILERHKVCQFAQSLTIGLPDAEAKKDEVIQALKKENKKLKSKLETSSLELERCKQRLNEFTRNEVDLNEQIKRLTGKLQDALEVIYILNPNKLDKFDIV